MKQAPVLAMLLAAMLTLPALAAASDHKGIHIGDSMPMMDIAMKSTDGTMVSLADVKGQKGTLVVFTCNHCPYVKAWEERTVALMNQAKQNGYGVIAINSNDPGKAQGDDMAGMIERASSAGMHYPYVMDKGSKLAAAFGATRTPEFFLFDKSGSLIYTGALDDNAQDASAVHATYLSDAMMAYEKGHAVEMATTKSVGCTIKWYE